MTASNASHGSKPEPAPAASGPTASPWLKILTVSAGAAAVLLMVTAAAAWVAAGWSAALSALLAGSIVVVFFGISLLIGHYVGRGNPSGAMGIFVVVYLIKVLGFAAVLFALGQPAWLDRNWFFGAAVATVIVWQTAEVAAFAKTRHLLYNDAGAGQGGADHGQP